MDDTIQVSNYLKLFLQIKKLLSLAFKMVDLGEIHSCLRIQIQQSCEKGILFLQKLGFILYALEKICLMDAHPTSTPIVMHPVKND